MCIGKVIAAEIVDFRGEIDLEKPVAEISVDAGYGDVCPSIYEDEVETITIHESSDGLIFGYFTLDENGEYRRLEKDELFRGY